MIAADDAEVASVRGLLSALNLESMIDVHTHFMPQRVLTKVWGYFDAKGETTGRDWPISYRYDEHVRIDLLRRFGVSAFTSMVYPHKADMAQWLNTWATDFATATPDCLHTATFYPEPSAPDYVNRAVESGAEIFKSHIQVGDYSPTDPLLDDVWGTLEDSGIPTVIHAGSGPTPGRFTGPGPISDLLQRHPRLKLIVAHMGLPEYREFLDIARQFSGVYLDTTMVFTDFTEQDNPFPSDALPQLLDLGDKILFGSDYPNLPYPYQHAVESIVRLGLGAEWCRKVLLRNAIELFPSARER